jgi:hypothetical protein
VGKKRRVGSYFKHACEGIEIFPIATLLLFSGSAFADETQALLRALMVIAGGLVYFEVK